MSNLFPANHSCHLQYDYFIQTSKLFLHNLFPSSVRNIFSHNLFNSVLWGRQKKCSNFTAATEDPFIRSKCAHALSSCINVWNDCSTLKLQIKFYKSITLHLYSSRELRQNINLGIDCRYQCISLLYSI